MTGRRIVAGRRWTAAELRQLPPKERNAILRAAAAIAEEEYRKDADLTAFEAFGKDDLHGGSASTNAVKSGLLTSIQRSVP
jgi:acyl-CoA reductase-like NAD-dependent aldehyde dehydrogenase